MKTYKVVNMFSNPFNSLNWLLTEITKFNMLIYDIYTSVDAFQFCKCIFTGNTDSSCSLLFQFLIYCLVLLTLIMIFSSEQLFFFQCLKLHLGICQTSLMELFAKISIPPPKTSEIQRFADVFRGYRNFRKKFCHSCLTVLNAPLTFI